MSGKAGNKMKNKFFLSLNVKILLVLFLSFAGICSLFLSTFMLSYVEQMDREAVLKRQKAQILLEMFEENMRLRTSLIHDNFSESDMMEFNDTSLQNIWKKQQEILVTLKPQDEMYFSMRRDLLKDINGTKDRDQKMKLLVYFTLSAFLLVFLILEILWMLVHRWILNPIEQLLDATHKIASGDFGARVPVSEKQSREDELDLLARDFNDMAESTQRAVLKIEEDRRFLQDMIDTIPDGIRVIDENYNIVLTNLAYENMNPNLPFLCDRKCHEVYGVDIPCTADLNPCPLLLLKEKPRKPVKLIQRYIDNENRERYLDVSAAALYQTINGKEEMWMIELVRPLDKEILFSHQQKLSAIGMLASSVAHEMRNPLGSVRLILENIIDRMDAKPVPRDELNRYLRLIYEQVTFCITVTSRLLKLARKSSNEIQNVDLNEVITETSSLLEYEAKKNGIEIIIREIDEAVIIAASDAEMRMLSVNLMQNAFHAMPEGGKLEIRTEIKNKKVCVVFEDTGLGIRKENLQRIFEPFFSESKERGGQGTGLGLSIVKTIVENYGGTISVESNVGQGTKFTLSFDSIN